MRRIDPNTSPSPLPATQLQIVQGLEDRGIEVWQQGDALLEDLRRGDSDRSPATLRSAGSPPKVPWRSGLSPCLLVGASAETLLHELPRAVVTARVNQRLSLGTTSGPIDLIPIGSDPIEDVLPRFGLSALAFAWRCVEENFVDPTSALPRLAEGFLDVVADSSLDNAFLLAPRRYWIAARLLAELDLEATPELIEAGKSALRESLDRIPDGSPARREIDRILVGSAASRGIQFLHDVGLCAALFPGMRRDRAGVIGKLDSDPSLRWAAWVKDCSSHRALRRLRMPIGRTRTIERLVRYHPIDGTATAIEDVDLRRLLQRLHPSEISGLIAWRRAELEDAEPGSETQHQLDLLDEIRERLAAADMERHERESIKQLAIDGSVVMRVLDCRPGPLIGRALAHLGTFVAATPDANTRDELEAELRRWAKDDAEDS